jgi:hypothetical protein
MFDTRYLIVPDKGNTAWGKTEGWEDAGKKERKQGKVQA